jgi:hypothetical protein
LRRRAIAASRARRPRQSPKPIARYLCGPRGSGAPRLRPPRLRRSTPSIGARQRERNRRGGTPIRSTPRRGIRGYRSGRANQAASAIGSDNPRRLRRLSSLRRKTFGWESSCRSRWRGIFESLWRVIFDASSCREPALPPHQARVGFRGNAFEAPQYVTTR